MLAFFLRFIRCIIQIVLALAALFIIFVTWNWWEIRQIERFFGEIHKGTAFSSLPNLAEKYGFQRHWVEHGIEEQVGGSWITFVPASSTMGEVACAIRYDKSGVISASIDPK